MKRKVKRQKLSDAKGFSLVEALVSLLITVLITGAMLGLLSRGQQTFRREPEVIDLQQNARIALDMVAKDVLQAGAALPPEFPAFTPPSVDPALGDGGAGKPDSIEIVGALQAPGEIQPEAEKVASLNPTDEVVLEQPSTQLAAGDLVVAYDNRPIEGSWIMAYVEAVTEDPTLATPAKLRLGPVLWPYSRLINTGEWRPRPKQPAALIARVSVVRYFIQPDLSLGLAVPPKALMRQADFGPPMPVSYLEDFQISYRVGNAPAVEEQDPPPPQPDAGAALTASSIVSGVNIQVSGRSLSENLMGSIAADAARGQAGNLVRKTFSSTTNPRNIGAGLWARSPSADPSRGYN